MLFKYTSLTEAGSPEAGTIEAVSKDVAISALQRRNLTILSIDESSKGKFNLSMAIGNHVSNRDLVIATRQISTLFTAQISALKVFRLLGGESESPVLRTHLTQVADDLQGGSSIAEALNRHPTIFSPFFVSMVGAAEESGKLSETFQYLADYLDRAYALVSKAKNALIYPAFVIVVFFSVMVLMLTYVIPNITSVLVEGGAAVPIYTTVVIDLSNFVREFGIFVLAILIVVGLWCWHYVRTPSGGAVFARFKIQIPFVGSLYRKLYLSRIADTMDTMLVSGIPMVRALEIAASVVDNHSYEKILKEAVEAVKGGASVADALQNHPEIPNIMVQMIRIGQETGEVGSILKTLAAYYNREVVTSVDTVVNLIEPAMIVLLGLGVGFLLAAVLLPIYNLSAAM